MKETCGDLQRHNSVIKTKFTAFLKEYRKVEIDKRNLGAREKETLTNLIRTVEALRTHVKITTNVRAWYFSFVMSP